ncbi:MAG TPA: hypothetical protein VHB18_11600 [Mycobacteriales bacterium]|jgi:hypothetical protein|nr:hypothetical protein [Mycobacteriales bacterium]
MTNDRDRRTEDALRRAMAGEADQVAPRGDGLMKIQQRVTAREARMRWLRPALAGGTAVVVIAAGIGGYAIAKQHDGKASVVVTNTPPDTPTPTPVAGGYPTAAIFPFTTAAGEQSWEKQFKQGSSPWVSDPTAVTESWLQYYLLQHGTFSYSAQTADGSSDVTVSRKLGGTDHAVSVVHLVQYHHAWLVTGASDPAGQLAFTAPTPGAAVTSPVSVSGPGYGVDMMAKVEVRNAETPDLFGQANTGQFGNGSAHWSASVPFTATSDAGVIVATVASEADGGLATLTAEKVTFSAASATPSAGSFYGAQNGRLAKFNGQTGAKEGDLDAASNEGDVTEVRQYGDTLYFTARVGDCIPTLYSMPTDGGSSPAVVASADPNYGIVGFDLSADGTKLTYLESSGCHQSMAGKGKLVFANLADGSSHTIDFPSEPPAIIGDPVWEADGSHVDAFVRTGNGGYLARYDSTSGTNPAPNANACSGYDINDGMPGAVTTGPDRSLWFAVQTGTSMQVISCDGTTPTVKFTVPKNDTPTSLAVNAAGSALLTDSSGDTWTWTPGQTSPRALSEASNVTSPTW